MEKIVIVGGGPGGLATAKILAQEGFKPILLENDKKFFQKACGEMVAEEFCGLNLYHFLSRPKEAPENKRIILKEFDKMIINFWDREYLFSLTGKNPFGFRKLLELDKECFEKDLAEQAEKAGAKIIMGYQVKEIKRKGKNIIVNDEIETEILIGADGFHSIVRKFTGQIIKKYGIAVAGYGNSGKEYPYFVFDPRIVKGGYGWLFPRKKGEDNIGCGTLEIKKVQEYLKKFLKKFNLELKNVRGAYLTAQLPIKSYFDNILLIGEAAAMTDPFWGGGINAALFSGYCAAKTVREAFIHKRKDEKFLKRYEREWRRKLYSVIFRNYFFQRIFDNFLLNQKTITSLGFKLLSKIN